MKEYLQKSIDSLRAKVIENLEVIHHNERTIRNIMNDEPVSDERADKVNYYLQRNKEILAENNDAINLQVSIIKYLEKYKKTLVPPQHNQGIENIRKVLLEDESIEEHEQERENDIFTQTIQGTYEFNQDHPFYNDDRFYEKLFNHYLENEAYEKCAELKKMR